MDLKIRDIKRENISIILKDIQELEPNWTAIGEEAWKKENFELDLEGKWELSFYVEEDGKIIGYVISSTDKGVGKLNKILVDERFRKQGIGRLIWNEFLKRLRNKGLEKAEFKVHVENESGINLYKKSGCLFYGMETGKDGRARHLCRYVFRLNNRIRHSKPMINSEDINAVKTAIQEEDVATGNVVNRFIRTFCDYIGPKYGIATNSGSNALYLALRALDIKEGDEVILPSYTCYSVLSSVINCRAKPAFADINEEDYNISFEDTKRKMSEKTKAIILPHMFGKPIQDIELFMDLGIPLIEDCALSLGASHDGKKAGSFGDISIFSFYATKLMTTGTGGMILTDNASSYNRLLDLTKYDKREEVGECYNFRMNDIQAALGMSQLKKLDEFIEKRRNIAKKYSDFFTDYEFATPYEKENIYFRYIIKAKEINSMITNLINRGVEVAKPVYKPIHIYLRMNDKDFPNTMKAHETAVSIPIYPSLTLEEAENISSAIVNWRQEQPYFINKGDKNEDL